MTGSDGRGHLRFSDFRSAADLLASALEASRDAERVRRQLMAMEAREGVRSQRYEPHGRSGHRADAMAQTDARMDRERDLSARVVADHEAMELAYVLLYGLDGRGGVWGELGAAADVLWWRYLDDATWDKCARMVGHGRTWCQAMEARAIALVDERGMEEVAGVPRGWHPDVDGEW